MVQKIPPWHYQDRRGSTGLVCLSPCRYCIFRICVLISFSTSPWTPIYLSRFTKTIIEVNRGECKLGRKQRVIKENQSSTHRTITYFWHVNLRPVTPSEKMWTWDLSFILRLLVTAPLPNITGGDGVIILAPSCLIFEERVVIVSVPLFRTISIVGPLFYTQSHDRTNDFSPFISKEKSLL